MGKLKPSKQHNTIQLHANLEHSSFFPSDVCGSNQFPQPNSKDLLARYSGRTELVERLIKDKAGPASTTNP